MNFTKIKPFLPLLLLIMTPFLMADVGPKPTAEFEILYLIDSPPQLTGYALYLCDDTSCEDPYMMDELGPQHFDCDQNSCSSMAYGYADYMFITLEFDDGSSRSSNIFTKNHFDAEYEIYVGPDSLEVIETGGSNMGSFGPLEAMITASAVVLICGGIVFVAVIILVIILVIRNQKKKSAPHE
jgi:hypothetical protein